MIIERKGTKKIKLSEHDFIVVPGYHVISIDNNGKRTKAFFAHTRADEYRHAEFRQAHRSNINRKPFRSADLKREARRRAVKVNGTFVADTGAVYHDENVKKVEA